MKKPQLEVYTNSEKTKAFIRQIPKNSAGKPITVDEILQIIKKASIRSGILVERINNILKEAQTSGKTPKNILVADSWADAEKNASKIFSHSTFIPLIYAAVLPLESQNRLAKLSAIHSVLFSKSLKSIWDSQLPCCWVKKDEIIGERNPTGSIRTIQNVFGESPIELSPDKILGLQPGENVGLNEKDGTLFALTDGILSYSNPVLSVLHPIWMDEEKVEAYLVLFPEIENSYQIEWKYVNNITENMGIRDEYFVENTKESLFESHENIRIELLAKGLSPVPGEDARLEYLVQFKSISPTLLEPMDFKSLCQMLNCKKGDIIAQKILAIPETAGHNLMGEPLLANPVNDVVVVLGRNIETEEQPGKVLYKAQCDGILRKGILGIENEVLISGNLDYSVGNLDVENSVVITNNVCSGFSIKTKGDIQIQGAVENGSHLIAEGTITVQGGIFGKATRIEANENIFVSFVVEATLVAKKCILVDKYCMQATLYSGDGIQIQGNSVNDTGALVSGLTNAKNWIAVKSIGSEMVPLTEVVLGLDLIKIDEKKQHITQLGTHKKAIQKIKHRIGVNADKKDFTKKIKLLPHEKRRVYMILLRQLKLLTEESAEIYSKLKDLSESASLENTKAIFQVEGAIHPDLLVQIGNFKSRVKTQEKNLEFFLDTDEDQILHRKPTRIKQISG